MTLLDALQPLPGSPGAAYHDWVAGLPDDRRERVAAAAPSLGPMFAAAPYLFELARIHADWLHEALASSAEACLSTILQQVAAEALSGDEKLGPVLRTLKGRAALLFAISEIGGVWSTKKATAAQSDFADAVLQAALDSVIATAAGKGQITIPEGKRPSERCGLVIFALGKQGGRELNYSSDVDIVAFYENDAPMLADPLEANRFYTRAVQRMVALIEERTALGFVFRTDLRLRPDPGSTPVALGINGALHYYESRGQNWERAAWIKARVCAGDGEVGRRFLDDLAPFIWRKHLDFATIADIQAIKRQINLVRRIGDERVEDHNVKLGRGGIREIEFFTQTQQLIAGGRDPALRVKPTTEALARLRMSGWISERTETELADTYWYLRAVENRLQMRRDEQTHSMPGDDEGIAAVATLMREPDVERFRATYRDATSCVSRHYSDLFAKSESLSGETGNLVFTGSDDDPSTLETLSALGFRGPSEAIAIVKKWHYGGYAATRTAAARAHLTSLLPALLKTIAEAGNADDALRRFDQFLSRLPAGVQLFSLLLNHEHLRRLLVAFMSSAPRLAEEVIHRAHVMDGLIGPTFADDLNSPTVMVERVDAFLADARSYEDMIDRARMIGQEQQFLISAGLISGTIDAYRAGQRFTGLAQTLLERLYGAVRVEFERQHGRVPGAATALLAFGKMASREMTATSDLDFILLYDAPAASEASDGPRSLATPHYYARLTQRLIAALSAPTAAGVLYEADMRLRPSGNKGPLATPLSGFRSYQMSDAWTWEHLALARSRVIFADDGLGATVEACIADILRKPRDVGKTIGDVLAMRDLMARERKPRSAFDLKLAPGGLVDIEFVAQSAQLLCYERIGLPQAGVPEVLARLGELGLLPDSARLAEIHGIYTTILQIMSTCLLRPFRDEDWTDAFRDLLAGMTNYPDFERLRADIGVMEADVQRIAAAWYEQVGQGN